MLAFERAGSGPPLVLLPGTTSSRSIWKPLLGELAREREVIAVDLPAHGESPPTSFTPPDWAREVVAFLDSVGIGRVSIVGHSSGGWTALEVAKLGRADAVLALAPAGLWRKHSPLVTDTILNLNWRLGQLLGGRVAIPLRSKLLRRIALRQISAQPANVSADAAIAAAYSAQACKHFPEHFKQTRRLRFTAGEEIPAEVPIRIVWGEEDRIARERVSRTTEALPRHASVETWSRCGHMLMWDAPHAVLDAAIALPTGELDAPRASR
jgi:pimeloyl-ACP methyl ester carboxylesterase